MTFNLIDLVSDSKIVTKKENKKKLHKLLDKYGSVEEIERKKDVQEKSKSELDVLKEKVDKANREIKVSDNEYSGTKTDAEVEKRDKNGYTQADNIQKKEFYLLMKLLLII